MGRPRKDGKKAASAVRIGRERPTGAGRTWRVRAYEPTETNPHGRVVYRNPQTGRATSAVPEDGQTLDEVFEQVEKALDQQVAMSVTRDETGQSVVRNVRALGDVYLDSLRRLKRDDAYIRNRRTLLTKWIYPVMGDVLVRDWSPTTRRPSWRACATRGCPRQGSRTSGRLFRA